MLSHNLQSQSMDPRKLIPSISISNNIPKRVIFSLKNSLSLPNKNPTYLKLQVAWMSLKKKVTSMEKSNMAQISSSMAIMSIHENPYLNLQKSNSCLQGNHFLTKASLKFFPSLRTTLYRCISNRLLPKIKMSFLSSPTCQPCIPQENPSNLKVFEFFSL